MGNQIPEAVYLIGRHVVGGSLYILQWIEGYITSECACVRVYVCGVCVTGEVSIPCCMTLEPTRPF